MKRWIEKIKQPYHFLLAWLGDVIYRYPSHQIKVIGVTGTKGKSTVVELLSAVLAAGGFKVAFASSVHIKIGDQTFRNDKGNSMPGRFFLQKFLRQAIKAGCNVAVIEVTSQGVVQYRHKFIDFDAVALTCLHPEHIESHGSFENYKQSKLDFFRYAATDSAKRDKKFFVNSESPYAAEFRSAAQGGGRVVDYDKETFLNRYLGGNRTLLGSWFESDFNLENAALVTEIAGSLGVSWPVIESEMQKFRGVPGRLEFIPSSSTGQAKQHFSVVVDYAHTPESLAGLYRFLKGKLAERGTGKLICVLGSAGGGRDKWKRPELGKVADYFCDEIILTNEDPYDEDPATIMKDIAEGIRLKPYLMIEARRSAIRRALEVARTGDIVAITGKGSELWLHIERGKKIPWNEREIVEACLIELGLKN